VFVFTLVLLIVLISLIGKSSSSITNVVVPANSTVAPAYIPTTHSLIKFFFK
jgi:Na+-transporting methylmalonyl-CoA/oxaloacetate decarboxylase gamma subunit